LTIDIELELLEHELSSIWRAANNSLIYSPEVADFG